MIDYCIKMPKNDEYEKGHRYPYYSCEILCSINGLNIDKLLNMPNDDTEIADENSKNEAKNEEEKEEIDKDDKNNGEKDDCNKNNNEGAENTGKIDKKNDGEEKAEKEEKKKKEEKKYKYKLFRSL
jgi:hypothetical protein